MVVFEIVLVAVCVVSAVIATVTFARASRLYDRIGRLGVYSMSIEERPSTPTREQARDEVDEMLQAIAKARKARGGPPPDLPELIEELRGNAAPRSVAERD
jgi:cytochrome P450